MTFFYESFLIGPKERATFRHSSAEWCNGSTSGSDPLSLGSSPSSATIFLLLNDLRLRSHIFKKLLFSLF